MVKNYAKNTKNLAIGICLLGAGYFLGGLTVYKQIFPFEQIKIVKKMLTGTHTEKSILPANTHWQERREQFEIF